MTTTGASTSPTAATTSPSTTTSTSPSPARYTPKAPGGYRRAQATQSATSSTAAST